MTWRDHLAKDAPITMDDAILATGLKLENKGDHLRDDAMRNIIFCTFTLLCYEWADMMIWQADREK